MYFLFMGKTGLRLVLGSLEEYSLLLIFGTVHLISKKLISFFATYFYVCIDN